MTESSRSARWIFLSYPLGEDTPTYGGGQGFRTEPDKRLDRGDSCNTSRWSLSNHIGTHIDSPRHFSAVGKTIDGYSPDFWVFSKVGMVDLNNIGEGEIITSNKLSVYDLSPDIELLLVRTGFCLRRSDPVYWEANPGFHPKVADSLRERFPRLRVLGFDSISVSSYANRPLGRETHRAFLDHERPILLLEDIDLSRANSGTNFKQVVIAPLMVKDADAAPCTVLAEIS